MNYSLIICNDLGRKFERWKEQNIIRTWQEVRKPYNKSKEEVIDFNRHQFFGSSSLNQVSGVKMEGHILTWSCSYQIIITALLGYSLKSRRHCMRLRDTGSHFWTVLPGESSSSLVSFKGGHHELSIFTSSKINDIGPLLLRQI